MGFVFGVALLLFVCSHAHGQRNKDVPQAPPNFIPGEVKPPASLQSDPKSPRRDAPKATPADKNGNTGAVKPKDSAPPQGR
jgi:hypothetical protein